MSGRWNDSDGYQEAWDADDPDAPQECDLGGGDDDETPTVPCPSCRQAVPEFADRCPYCGDWIVPSAGERTGRGPWVWVAAVAAGAGILLWYVF
jgi:hypothetical protein